MKKNRIKAYWLLLLVLLYTAGAVLSVGEAQARYVTTATWNTVVQQGESAVTSDCLEDISGAPLTILLGAMPREAYPVSFRLTADAAASGNLAWSVDLPEYITVQMHIDDTVITPETTIEMAAGDTVTVIMTLIPSETAFTEVRSAVNVSVTVTWADTLQGTFLTQLPAVEEEENPTEAPEPDPTEAPEPDPTEAPEPDPTEAPEPDPTEAPEPDPTESPEPDPTEAPEPDPTEAPEPDPTEAPEPDPTEPPEPDPTEVSEPNPTDSGAGASAVRMPAHPHRQFENPGIRLTTNTETSDDETVPEEDATEPVAQTEPDPTEAPEEQSEEPEDPGDGTGDSENGSESPGETEPDPTEPSEPVQEENPAASILLEAVSSVNPADALPIQITAPENGGAVRLGLATVVEPTDAEGESQTVLDNFPQYTRFSLTNGESCYMLYHADTIVLNPEAGQTISVLLDLSHVQLEQFQVVLGAALQGGESRVSTCTATVIPESAQYTSVSSRILSVGMPLTITVSEYGQNYSLEYTVEMLTTIQSEDGEAETVGYVAVELPENCLLSELTTDETGTRLILSIGETLPPAGTYRVSLNWIFEEICYAQTQETFFINYTIYTESEETGGAVQ